MNNVLITGANGFIGSWLTNFLSEKKINVYAVIRNEKSDKSKIIDSSFVHFLYSDLDNILELEKSLFNVKIDTIYHFAWEGVGGAKRAEYNIQLKNVQGACDCMVLASKIGCEKFLCAGTISEKIAENILTMDTAAENNIYAISKSTANRILKVLSRKFGIELIWMRLANSYGPNNQCGNIVNYILDKFKEGEKPELSDCNQPYDVIYIEDLVEAIFLLGYKNVSKDLYYIGSGTPQTLKEIISRIRDAYPKDVEVLFGAKPDDGLKFKDEWFGIDDLVRDTGYASKYSIEEGIIKTVNSNVEEQ